jgi:hypothetical protein
MHFIPFGGAYFQRQHFTASGAGASSSDNFNNGLYELGIVLVANQRISIGPVMRNVFGIEHSGRAAYGLIASFSFGQ